MLLRPLIIMVEEGLLLVIDSRAYPGRTSAEEGELQSWNAEGSNEHPSRNKMSG